MSKKFTKGLSSLSSLLNRAETEAKAKAAALPKRPTAPVKSNRQISDSDQFIIDTLALQLGQLPPDQLPDARSTIIGAIECANNSMVSIQQQIDTRENPYDDQGRSWKPRAEAALRFKRQEEQGLQKQLALVDNLIARAKPSLKLVTPTPSPEPTRAYEIRSGIERPTLRRDEWRKYPFDRLEVGQSFRFDTETAEEVRNLITAAQRHLDRRFSYRTESDGVIAVWRTEEPPRPRKGKSD